MSVCIQFSNPNGIYYPGQEIIGKVILNSDYSIKARSIRIFFDGRAHSHWSEDHRSFDNRRSTAYKATIIYVSGEAVVWEQTPKNCKILPGLHKFPFKFLLPTTCHPSFEGLLGYIRYTVKSTFDLNSIPQSIQQVSNIKTKEIGIPFYGQIHIEARIPKMGYVSGETIRAQCIVDNKTSRPVISGKIKLNQVSRYKAACGHWKNNYSVGLDATRCKRAKEKMETIGQDCKHLNIPPKSKANVQIGLVIPPCVVSFNTCPIITVEYYVTVKLILESSLCSSVKSRLPVFIGTIPISHQNQPTPSSELPPSYISAFRPGETTRNAENTEAFPPRYEDCSNLAPPRYETTDRRG